ncbi:hypothetical protein CISIN_1g044150mg [Citrus sinensis]|uniref:GATA-type domain-containing protein n=1 Tax=Citrus sinensis TaxID=2711 RepID=A0A067FUM8_CITSI|nr:hypothetical protein CISIN_1g044150mg [Citrus sinensis]
MLYQTHHLNFFQFHTFTPIHLSATSLLSSPPPPPPPTDFQDMECVEAALKTSLRKEMALKLSPQAVDEICAVNLPNGVACDDFFVDDLLDFSNEDVVAEQQQLQEPQQEKGEEQKKHTLTVCSKQDQDLDERLNFDDLGPIPTSELAVPTDDVANLEWLSHFVEDSFAEYSSPFPAGTLPVKAKENGAEPEHKPALAIHCFKTPIPAKARSKRSRTGLRIWSLGSPSLSDSSSTSSASSSSSPSSPWPVSTNPGSLASLRPAEPFIVKPPKKKLKKKSPPEGYNAGGNISWGQVTRRCSHCGVQKTPQWRTGPLGAKTLCNACGVRYKSGRLFPEYRPACSPTFSSELHSNHHRKVMEMRRKKEGLGRTEPGLAPAVVSSF